MQIFDTSSLQVQPHSWLFFFYQYALNIEQFDVAKQLREKLTEVT